MDELESAERVASAVLVLLGEIRDRNLKELKHQLKRAIVSVPSNIAEGRGRRNAGSDKDEGRFKRFAIGSLKEAMSQLRILNDVIEASDPMRKRIGLIIDDCMKVEEMLTGEMVVGRLDPFPDCGCPDEVHERGGCDIFNTKMQWRKEHGSESER